MNTINFGTGRICNVGLTETDGSASTFQWRKNNVLFLISGVHWIEALTQQLEVPARYWTKAGVAVPDSGVLASAVSSTCLLFLPSLPSSP